MEQMVLKCFLSTNNIILFLRKKKFFLANKFIPFEADAHKRVSIKLKSQHFLVYLSDFSQKNSVYNTSKVPINKFISFGSDESPIEQWAFNYYFFALMFTFMSIKYNLLKIKFLPVDFELCHLRNRLYYFNIT